MTNREYTVVPRKPPGDCQHDSTCSMNLYLHSQRSCSLRLPNNGCICVQADAGLLSVLDLFISIFTLSGSSLVIAATLVVCWFNVSSLRSEKGPGTAMHVLGPTKSPKSARCCSERRDHRHSRNGGGWPQFTVNRDVWVIRRRSLATAL